MSAQRSSRAFIVSVQVSDLRVPASALAARVRAAAEAAGASAAALVISEDGTALSVSFVVEASDQAEARRRGEVVLDAVAADDFAWQVGVMQTFER